MSARIRDGSRLKCFFDVFTYPRRYSYLRIKTIGLDAVVLTELLTLSVRRQFGVHIRQTGLSQPDFAWLLDVSALKWPRLRVWLLCDLHRDANSVSTDATSSVKVIDEVFGCKWAWPSWEITILEYSWRDLRKTWKYLSWNNLFPDRDLKVQLPEYSSVELAPEYPTCRASRC